MTSNGNAGLVPASLEKNRSVISHNKTTLIDVHCSATKSGQRLAAPWSETGQLSGDYVTNKGKMDMHAVSFQDQPTLRTETMLKADAGVQHLRGLSMGRYQIIRRSGTGEESDIVAQDLH